MKDPEVQRCRPRAMRDDFLVRNVGPRAILVVLMRSPRKLSEFEEYNLITCAAEAARKQHWKSVTLEVSIWGDVTAFNAQGAPVELGSISQVCDSQHFLNDPYFSPEGFWINPIKTYIKVEKYASR